MKMPILRLILNRNRRGRLTNKYLKKFGWAVGMLMLNALRITLSFVLLLNDRTLLYSLFPEINDQ